MYLVLCGMLVSNVTTKVLMVICLAIIILSQKMFGSSVTTEATMPLYSQICRIMWKNWRI